MRVCEEHVRTLETGSLSPERAGEGYLLSKRIFVNATIHDYVLCWVRVSIDLHNPATVTATKHQDNAMDPGSHTNLPTHLTATFIDQAYEPSQTSKCIPRGDSDMSFGTAMRTLRWKQERHLQVLAGYMRRRSQVFRKTLSC